MNLSDIMCRINSTMISLLKLNFNSLLKKLHKATSVPRSYKVDSKLLSRNKFVYRMNTLS